MLKMNCTSCGTQLDSSKKGFIVCPICGAVNIPTPSAGLNEHHTTHLPYHGTIANGKPKHWHTIHVIAQKPLRRGRQNLV